MNVYMRVICTMVLRNFFYNSYGKMTQDKEIFS